MRKKGFTMIELLVVVTIIIILMSILLPTFLSMQGKAEETKCLANLSALGKALFNYANDNKARFPAAVADNYSASWLLDKDASYDPEGMETGSLYLDELISNPAEQFVCQSADTLMDPRTGNMIDPLHSYTMNIRFSRSPMTKGAEMATQIILMLEESHDTLLKPPKGGTERYGAFEDQDQPARRHRGYTNVLYLDTHVGAVRFDPDVKAEDDIFSRDPTGARTRTPGAVE